MMIILPYFFIVALICFQAKCFATTDCSKRFDDIYSVFDCDSTFVDCKNGQATVGNCKENYLFNEESGLCETANEVFCPDKIPDGAEMECSNGSVIHYWKSTIEKETTTVTSSTNDQNLDLDDFQRAKITCQKEGYFAMDDCSPIYKVCLNNTATFHKCPIGLVFNSIALKCSNSCDILEKQSTTVTPMNDQSLELDDFQPGEITCQNDGTFAITDCSRIYKVCLNSTATFHECPNDLVFNSNALKCSGSCDILEKQSTTVTSSMNDQSLELDAFQFADVTCQKDGFFAIADCSPIYEICLNNIVTFHECPNDLVFNPNTLKCTSSCDVLEQQSTTVTSSMNDQNLELDAFQFADVTCQKDGFFAIADCSRIYKVCLNNTATFHECPNDLVFNSNALKCSSSCDVLEKQSTTVASSMNDQNLELDTFQHGEVSYQNDGSFEHHSEEENFWRRRRSAAPICWIKQHAYRPVASETVSTRLVDDEFFEVQSSLECLGREDGHIFVSGVCRRTYFVCFKGISVQKSCLRSGDVFDLKSNACVTMIDVPECEHTQNSDDLRINSNITSFCENRKDGFYRHPLECHRIFQCFGKNIFEYPSCEHGLAFDERRGKCDYQRNVPGCGPTMAFDENSTSGCNGHEHGEHIVDEADCNSFYRCVWNQLERMTCPQGTVFNPAISVCDYPNQVVGCSQ